MAITVPEPTSAAAIASLTAALGSAGTTDASVGATLLASLTEAASSYNAAATRYNTDEAAYPALLSASVTNGNAVADRVQAIAPFTEPAPVSDPRINAINRCRAATRAYAGPTVTQAAQAALLDLTNTSPPTQPRTDALSSLVSEANAFVVYLEA